MLGIFNGCSSLTGLDLSGWNTSRLRSMSDMFSGCSVLETLTLGENTTSSEKNIFTSLPGYNDGWIYTAQGAAADDPLELNTVKKNASLFTGYDFHTMAGTWSLLPKASAITIKNSGETDITGKTITSDTLEYQLKASAEPAEAEQAVTWTSGSEAVALVSEGGMVTFEKPGKVRITATSTDRGAASSWVDLKLLPEAAAITIINSNGTDITGKTVTSEALNYQLNAIASPADAAQTVTWKSSSTDIAAVDINGKVMFKTPGTVTITAMSTDRGKKTAMVNLKLLPEATAITITDSAGTNITGKTITSNTANYQLKASAAPSNAAQTVTWKSSDTAVAAVDTNGKVTFKTAGTITITATSTDRGKKAASVKLTLLPRATSIVIKNSAGTVVTGKTVTAKTRYYQLKASAKPAEAAQTVTWKSSNTSIATVSSTGKVTFKKAGTVTITATSTDRGKKAASVKVTLLPKATSIVIKDPNGKIITGKTIKVTAKTIKLTASAKPAKAEQTVTWKSSDTSIATVSRTGKVTFKKAGTVKITAKSTDRGKKIGAVKLTYKP